MPKYSRTKKYEELRNSLQNDAETSISTNELSEFANRLNRIDSNNFESMEEVHIEHDPIHRRREFTFNSEYAHTPVVNEPNVIDGYMDDIYKEVKQYNLENGFLISDNTQQNILRELKGERPSPTNTVRTTEAPEIPSFTQKPAQPRRVGDTKTLSADDIALRERITSEMNNILNNEPDYSYINEMDDEPEEDILSSLENTLAFEKQEREKITHETQQMRAKLDEYEDSLSDISDNAQRTSRILNFILIVLIFAVLVVFAVILYMVLLNNGVI